MSSAAFFWLALNFLAIAIQGFYSMMEMACVSFNRVRLHYYVSKGNQRAIWLSDLLHHPSYLFGTTLIGVNVAMNFGSEFAREFHIALGVSPDLAPLSQVLLVVILAELSPLFAARSHSEYIAMAGIPLLYTSAKLMTPFLWMLDQLTSFFSSLFNRKKMKTAIYITQEELQKILEEQEEDQPYASDREQFNVITSSIFSLRHKETNQIMIPIERVPAIAANATIEQIRAHFKKTRANYLPIYHNDRSNIVGIAFPRDLIRAADSRKVREFARTPWFVTQNAKLPTILKQFRRNNQEVALILDSQGYTIGLITLDLLIEEIFGKVPPAPSAKMKGAPNKRFILDRTFPASMTVGEFHSKYQVFLDENTNLTIEEVLEKHLGYHPSVGESIYIDPYEISVKETTLHTVKSVTIKNKIK